MKKTIILAATAVFLFTGCLGGAEGKEEWTALIFPDKENTKRSKKFAVYKTLEECREGSKNELSRLGLSDRGDYKCGLNCKYHEGMKLDICEKLVQ